MQAGLGIIVLAGKAGVIRDVFGIDGGFAEGGILRGPHDHPVLRGQFLQGTEMIVLIKVVCSSLLQEERIGGPGGVRLLAIRTDFRAAGVGFCNLSLILWQVKPKRPLLDGMQNIPTNQPN